EDNAAALIAQLLKERGWGVDRVKKHQDFSGKYCPHRTLDLGWDRFINKIKSKMGGSVMPNMYKGYDLTNIESMKVAVDVLVDVVKNKLYLKISELAEFGADSLEGLRSVVAGYKSRITDLGNQLGIAQAEVENRKEQVSRTEAEVLRL